MRKMVSAILRGMGYIAIMILLVIFIIPIRQSILKSLE
jgi:hypothetical protein